MVRARERPVTLNAPPGKGTEGAQAHLPFLAAGQTTRPRPLLLTLTAVSAPESGPALPGLGAQSHFLSERGRRRPSREGPG